MPGESRPAASFEKLTNRLGVGNCFTGIGLPEALFDFRQKAKPFDGIFKRGGVWKPLNGLKNLLFDRSGYHSNHLLQSAL